MLSACQPETLSALYPADLKTGWMTKPDWWIRSPGQMLLAPRSLQSLREPASYERILPLMGQAASKELGRLVVRINLLKDRLKVHLNLHALVYENTEFGPILGSFEAAFEKRQKVRAKPIVIVPKDALQPDSHLIALIADARRWASELLDGSAPSIRTMDNREGLRSGTVSRILPLAWLAPDISAAIFDGNQPAQITAKLCEHFLSCLWSGKISVRLWASRINKALHVVQDLTPNRSAETSGISWSKSP